MWGLCATIASLAALGGYSLMFFKEYNKFGLTSISTWNNYVTIREARVIHIDEIESPEIRHLVDSMLQLNGPCPPSCKRWDEAERLHYDGGIDEFDKFVNCQIRRHPKEVLSFLYHERLETLLNNDCVFTGSAMPPHVSSFTRVIRVNSGTAFLIFLAGLAAMICRDIRERRISYFLLFLYSLFAANYFTVWVGAPDSFPRLLAQNYPVLIAISCRLLDDLASFAVAGQYKQNFK